MKQLITGELPKKTDLQALKLFFDNVDTNEYLAAKEKDFFQHLGYNFRETQILVNRLGMACEAARSRWACISAKSQRKKETEAKGRKDWYHKIDIYEGLTTVQPVYERQRPVSAGREPGEVIQTFTKRSRQRLLSKARRLNKSELPLPYFVTLTYQDNFQDFERAKEHLNAFLQRFRRMDEIPVKYTKLSTGRINTRKISADQFQYFWKMEPQKRGSIHFHLAIFEPKDLFPKAWQDKPLKDRLEFVRCRISAAWNEVSEQSKEFKPVRSKNGKYFGNMALLAGTNVRAVENWKMFVGYVGKYMKKEVVENPWGGVMLQDRKKFKKISGRAGVKISVNDYLKNPDRFKFEPDQETGELKRVRPKTGRWWGFSYGLDFKALQQTAYTKEDKKNLNDFCNALNGLTFKSITEQLISNAERAKKNLKGKRLNAKLMHYRNMYESQKRRYLVNKDKIKEGYMLQFEVDNKVSRFCSDLLDDESIKSLFEP